MTKGRKPWNTDIYFGCSEFDTLAIRQPSVVMPTLPSLPLARREHRPPASALSDGGAYSSRLSRWCGDTRSSMATSRLPVACRTFAKKENVHDAVLKEVFNYFDADCSGTLDAHEFVTMVQRLGLDTKKIEDAAGATGSQMDLSTGMTVEAFTNYCSNTDVRQHPIYQTCAHYHRTVQQARHLAKGSGTELYLSLDQQIMRLFHLQHHYRRLSQTASTINCWWAGYPRMKGQQLHWYPPFKTPRSDAALQKSRAIAARHDGSEQKKWVVQNKESKSFARDVHQLHESEFDQFTHYRNMRRHLEVVRSSRFSVDCWWKEYGLEPKKPSGERPASTTCDAAPKGAPSWNEEAKIRELRKKTRLKRNFLLPVERLQFMLTTRPWKCAPYEEKLQETRADDFPKIVTADAWYRRYRGPSNLRLRLDQAIDWQNFDEPNVVDVITVGYASMEEHDRGAFGNPARSNIEMMNDNKSEFGVAQMTSKPTYSKPTAADIDPKQDKSPMAGRDGSRIPNIGTSGNTDWERSTRSRRTQRTTGGTRSRPGKLYAMLRKHRNRRDWTSIAPNTVDSTLGTYRTAGRATNRTGASRARTTKKFTLPII